MATDPLTETNRAEQLRPRQFTSTRPLARQVHAATVLYLAAAAVQFGIFGWRFVALRQARTAGATGATALNSLTSLVNPSTIAMVDGPLKVSSNVAAALLLAATLLLAVVFLTWQVRSLDNHPALGALKVRYGKTSSVLSWLVPIWNLFGPKQVMNDLWRGSDPTAPMPVDVVTRPVPSWLLVWWLPTLLGLEMVTTRTVINGATVGAAWTALILGAVTTSAGVIGAIMLIRLVRLISDRQVERAQRYGIIPG